MSYNGNVITYYAKSGDMVAHCKREGHGPKCRATRTTMPKTARKRGAGRPIGFLLAWLADDGPAGGPKDKADHKLRGDI
eukprot:2868692-Pyramimonas_sp.AAC.1